MIGERGEVIGDKLQVISYRYGGGVDSEEIS